MDKRSGIYQANCESVRRTHKLLEGIAASENCPEALASACKAQGTLAEFEDESLGIKAMSLNTFKKCADDILECKFVGINKLRLDALKQKVAATAAVSNEVARGYADAQRLRVILVRAHLELLELAKEACNDNKYLMRRLSDHHNKYRAFFGPTKIS